MIVNDGGAEHVFSVPEFMALPIHERVRLVLGRRLEFFRGEVLVERSVALKSLRENDLKTTR